MLPKRIAIVDTETTGVDPEKDRVVELAVITFDLERAAPVEHFASLLRADANPAEHVNRIPAALLSSAPESGDVWGRAARVTADCSLWIAHNAAFDKQFFPKELRDQKPWVCSMADLVWPEASKAGMSLAALALAHGVGVVAAHRALTDCDILSRLFMRIAERGIDLPAFIALGLRPKVRVQALVSYDDRNLAKEAGFQWDGAKKMWFRDMVEEDIAKLTFKYRRVEESKPAAQPGLSSGGYDLD